MRIVANSLVTSLASTSLVVLTALAAGSAQAADLDAASAVDAVTVYPDGASVTRLIAADLPAGDNTLVLHDFPLGLDLSSLRVEGEAGAKLTIGAIDAKPPRAAILQATARGSWIRSSASISPSVKPPRRKSGISAACADDTAPNIIAATRNRRIATLQSNQRNSQ